MIFRISLRKRKIDSFVYLAAEVNEDNEISAKNSEIHDILNRELKQDSKQDL